MLRHLRAATTPSGAALVTGVLRCCGADGRTLAQARHNYMGHNYMGHNCMDYMGHKYIDHNYMGRNFIDHNYMGRNYVGHNYMGRNYMGHSCCGADGRTLAQARRTNEMHISYGP